MQSIGIKLHLCPAGTPAKKIHGAPFADKSHAGLPGFRFAHCFHHRVKLGPGGFADLAE